MAQFCTRRLFHKLHDSTEEPAPLVAQMGDACFQKLEHVHEHLERALATCSRRCEMLFREPGECLDKQWLMPVNARRMRV